MAVKLEDVQHQETLYSVTREWVGEPRRLVTASIPMRVLFVSLAENYALVSRNGDRAEYMTRQAVEALYREPHSAWRDQPQ